VFDDGGCVLAVCEDLFTKDLGAHLQASSAKREKGAEAVWAQPSPRDKFPRRPRISLPPQPLHTASNAGVCICKRPSRPRPSDSRLHGNVTGFASS
jgi:hypothetical protein